MLTIDQTKTALSNLIGQNIYNDIDFRERDDGNYGRMLEAFLGVIENNRQNADVQCDDGVIELKTVNTNSRSKISLFTKEPSWNLHNGYNSSHDVARAFHTTYRNDVYRCNTTITNTPNNKGLYLRLNHFSLNIMSTTGVVGSWNIQKIILKVRAKLGNVAFIYHNNGIVSNVTFMNANIQNFMNLLQTGDLVIELRMKTGAEKKNRGTVFRIFENKLHLLFG